MQFETRHVEDIVIVTPAATRIDATLAPAFRTALTALIDAGDRFIVVNLRWVENMDSAGVAALLGPLKRLADCGTLKVCAASPHVLSMFEATRLHRVIPILASEREALLSFGVDRPSNPDSDGGRVKPFMMPRDVPAEREDNAFAQSLNWSWYPAHA